VAFDFFLRDPEFGQDLLVWNTLVMLGPLPRVRERFFFFRRERLVIDGRVAMARETGSSMASSRPTTAES
jgi:hypothetical protein